MKTLTKKKEGERKCFNRFGINKSKKCIFDAILRSLEKKTTKVEKKKLMEDKKKY